MFKKILVGLDDAETCDTLFEKALMLARCTGANLLLISVISPIDSFSPPILASSGKSYNLPNTDQSVWSVYRDIHQEYIDKARERLSHFVKRAQAAHIETDYVQRVGSPGHAICEQAKASDADVILVGSHGRSGLSELWLGSVSNYVLHHAPCSVCVIREQGQSRWSDEGLVQKCPI
ncbi:MAG: universal stress protein [Cyanobacteria bacterium P01_F01_bin.53]